MNPIISAIETGPLEYGNSPFWYSKTQCYYFVNVYRSEIHRYDPQLKKHVYAKIGNQPVAFAIPIADFEDKFLIGYGSDLAAITWDERSNYISKLKIIEQIDPTGRNVISDGKISPTGILFIGTSGPGNIPSNNLQLNQAALFSFKDCEISIQIPKVSVSGGMAWAKEQTFYYIDSPEYRVERYCFDKRDCKLTSGCILYEFKDDDLPGFPCGMTIDTKGQLWVGCFNGGQIIKIDTKTGKCVAKIEIPNCPQITSLAFGGKNLDTLFVTSASYKLENKSSCAGCMFQITGLDVKGYEGVPLRLISK